MLIKASLCVFLSVLLPTAWAFYSPSDGVIELTPTNFDRLVVQDNAIWIVEFYAPWCGHCKNLVPEYKKLANAVNGIFKVGAVDADKHRSLSKKYDVKGYPTIKIFGANKSSPTDFLYQRTAKLMADAVLAEAKKKIEAALVASSSH